MSGKSYGLWSFVILSYLFLLLQNSIAAEFHIGVPVPEKTKEYQLLLDRVKLINTQTNGRIAITLHFFTENQAPFGEMVKKGQLDGCLAIETDFSSLGLRKESLVYALPFLFSSSDDVAALRSKLDIPLLKSMSNDEMKAVGFVDFGFIYMGSTESLAAPESWKKQRFWLPASDGFTARCLQSTGLQFSTVEFKRVLNELKNDEIQGVLAPLPLVIMKRWHTQLKCVYRVPVVYSYGIWTVNRNRIAGLDGADSNAFYAALEELGETLEKAMQQRYESSVKVLERYGITFIDPIPAISAEHYGWLRGWLPEVQKELKLSTMMMQHVRNYVYDRK